MLTKGWVTLTHYPKVVVFSGLMLLSTIFQSYHNSVWFHRELSAHFYSTASLKYHAPDTWHDTAPTHIILTLGRLVSPRKSKSEVLSDPKIAGQLRKYSSGHATRFLKKKSRNFEIPAIMAKNLWVCAKPQHCHLCIGNLWVCAKPRHCHLHAVEKNQYLN